MKKRLSLLLLALAVLALLAVGCLGGLTYYVYVDRYKVTTKYTTATMPKSFKTIERKDPSFPKGERRVETKGQNGIVKVTYLLTYRGSELTSKKKVKEVLIKKPVDQIVAIGTRTEAPYPATPEDVIRAYYAAINDHRWEEAWNYLTARQQATYSVPNPGPPEMAAWTGIDRFQHTYGDYVRTVSVTSVSSMPGYPVPNTYHVDFNADYIRLYPAGSRRLPDIHILVQDSDGRWKIDTIGTG